MASSVADQHQNSSSLPAADPESAAHAHAETTTRPRKRRRRTVACTQCRTRKLKCDREYPTCGRCLKSRTPGRCTYEDSFVWQQPKTVPASSSSTSPAAVLDHFSASNSYSNNNNGGQFSLPPANSVGAMSPPSGASVPISSRGYTLPPSEPRPAGPSRPRFLDTVLDAPNPPAGSTWASIPENNVNGCIYHPRHNHGLDHQDSNDQTLASPSQKLELPNKFFIRGKETRTRFNGSGIFANLFLQVGSWRGVFGILHPQRTN